MTTNGTTAWRVRGVPLPEGGTAVDIWVDDGEIVAGPIEGATVLECSFVSPGLVDCHGHLSMPFQECLGHRFDEQFVSGARSESPEVVLDNLARHLASGVTAIRDAGYVRQQPLVDGPLPPRPQLIRSGWIVVPDGRYFPGSEIGKSTEAEGLVDRVREAAAAGMTWFKIIADFPGDDMDLFTAPLTYPFEALRDAIGTAHELGMRVMAHSTGPCVDQIIEAGVDSIEHGCSVSVDVAEMMGRRGVAWAPTLATVDGHLDMLDSLGVQDESANLWRESITKALAAAVDSNVPLLVGSDELPHGRLVDEALAMARFGVPAPVVLASATTTARSFLGLQGLEVGAPADLVCFDGDPRDDLSVLGKPSAVLALGEKQERSA